jgi:hypothetical protein
MGGFSCGAGFAVLPGCSPLGPDLEPTKRLDGKVPWL